MRALLGVEKLKQHIPPRVVSHELNQNELVVKSYCLDRVKKKSPRRTNSLQALH